jgi:hypothetical protein
MKILFIILSSLYLVSCHKQHGHKRSRRSAQNEQTLSLKATTVTTDKEDVYMCFPTVLPSQDMYIVKYTPHADMSISHHMLIYGCEVPRSNQPYECQTMGVCKTDFSQIVYGWAMNAPALTLPDETGFHVGGSNKIKTLVLQFHYKKIGTWNGGNGVDLTYLTKEPARLAGIYLMSTDGSLPPHRSTNLDAACTYEGSAVLTPIAFRTHGHTWCEVVSGYRVRNQQWTELGRHSPQLPQVRPLRPILLKFPSAFTPYPSLSLRRVARVDVTYIPAVFEIRLSSRLAHSFPSSTQLFSFPSCISFQRSSEPLMLRLRARERIP